ncbi:hypothetical protein B0H21DRAFT_443160 [Amylocystis lapponica]|nr:hypothetical protein B0H21DRAFT_443160 [Amylocystis lapponica]
MSGGTARALRITFLCYTIVLPLHLPALHIPVTMVGTFVTRGFAVLALVLAAVSAVSAAPSPIVARGSEGECAIWREGHCITLPVAESTPPPKKVARNDDNCTIWKNCSSVVIAPGAEQTAVVHA